MEVRLLAAGTRLPRWIDDGYQHYAGRLTRELNLVLDEIPVAARRGGDAASWRAREGKVMLSKIRTADWLVALEVDGKSPDTERLAGWIEKWLGAGRRIVLAVGGPDGLAPEVLQRADQRWSLSPLTLPHGLVRVVLAEALYRAWSLRNGHPYHRA